jgi:lipopolysaccharide/colanic/teichoic acid biosynthesis glycosyltransferase
VDHAFAARLHFDEYYIRNWSLWLDYYILSRTMMGFLKGSHSK